MFLFFLLACESSTKIKVPDTPKVPTEAKNLVDEQVLTELIPYFGIKWVQVKNNQINVCKGEPSDYFEVTENPLHIEYSYDCGEYGWGFDVGSLRKNPDGAFVLAGETFEGDLTVTFAENSANWATSKETYSTVVNTESLMKIETFHECCCEISDGADVWCEVKQVEFCEDGGRCLDIAQLKLDAKTEEGKYPNPVLDQTEKTSSDPKATAFMIKHRNCLMMCSRLDDLK